MVLIGGAFNDRTTILGLAWVLAPYYRAVIYDRRRRGPFGHSSGAVLALEATRRRLVSLVRSGDRDGATALFQTEVIGLPAEMVAGIRQSDLWGYLTGLAHTLPYDYALFEAGNPVPAGRLAEITVPVLAIAGSNTFPWLAQATEQVARAIPGGRFLSARTRPAAARQVMSRRSVVRAAIPASTRPIASKRAVAAANGSGVTEPAPPPEPKLATPSGVPASVVAAVYGRYGWTAGNRLPISVSRMIDHTKAPMTTASWERISEPTATPITPSSAPPTRCPAPQFTNVAAPIDTG